MSRPRRRRPPSWYRGAIGFATVVWLCIIGAIGACIGLALAAPAHSTPGGVDPDAFAWWAHHGSRVCAVIDRQPTVDGIDAAGQYVQQRSGLNTRQSWQVVGLSVEYTCPRHTSLVDRYLAQHTRIKATIA